MKVFPLVLRIRAEKELIIYRGNFLFLRFCYEIRRDIYTTVNPTLPRNERLIQCSG